MIITTTPSVEGKIITEYLGLVSGAGSYMVAGLFGEGYGKKIGSLYFQTARDDALNGMQSEALTKKADAVIGVQMSVSETANQTLVSVMGTAVRLGDAIESDELPDL